MMNDIKHILDELKQQGNLRAIGKYSSKGRMLYSHGREYVNLSSNDYLGLAADTSLQKAFWAELPASEVFLMSSSSSRLITGNSHYYDALEDSISAMYPGKEALVLGSGYLLNSALLPALTTAKDLIVADRLVHASIIDGILLSDADWKRFHHNDMGHLESILRKERSKYRNVWIVTESIFSMDGDKAPLAELVEFKKRYDVKLYVDEAHALGVRGRRGEGLAEEMGLGGSVDILIATFGKALASTGAYVVCDAVVKQLLINKMRTLIFSTAIPPLNLMWSKKILDMLPTLDDRREKLRALIELLTGDADATHIVPVITFSNENTLKASDMLRENGYWATPVRYPTVPKNMSRLRISLTASLEAGDIIRLKELCKNIG